ncbi:MAG: sialidase family protein [Gemmatimonadota bacterium]|nr:sialidase family protein [Gemmatimonadota bacterium]
MLLSPLLVIVSTLLPAPESPASASGPALAWGARGEMIVAWESGRGAARDILFRRLDADGGPLAPVRLDEDGDARSLEVRLAAGSRGVVHATWQDSRAGLDDIFHRRSPDGGRSWPDPATRVDTTPRGSSVSSLPAIATDDRGTVWVAWEDLRNGRRDLYLNRSTDGGVSWLAEDVRIDSDLPGAADSYHPHPVALQEGRVLLVWWDERGAKVSVLARTGGGVPFAWDEPEVRIDPESAAGREVAVSVSDVGAVALAWEEGLAEATVVAVRVSKDGGSTWREVAHPSQGDGAVSRPFPAWSSDGALHVAWREQRAGGAQILHSLSGDGGESWTPPAPLSGVPPGGNAMRPLLAEGGGRLWAVWTEREAGRSRIVFRSGTGDGRRWAPQEVVAGEAGASADSPRILVAADGALRMVWRSVGAPGSGSLRLARIPAPVE